MVSVDDIKLNTGAMKPCLAVETVSVVLISVLLWLLLFSNIRYAQYPTEYQQY